MGGRKLLDQFRDKMRSLHYALATEKAYRHWIVEFPRYHRARDQWKHPATLGKPEIEAFLTHLATTRKVSAKTQNEAFSAVLFLYRRMLELEFPTIDALGPEMHTPIQLKQEGESRSTRFEPSLWCLTRRAGCQKGISLGFEHTVVCLDCADDNL